MIEIIAGLGATKTGLDVIKSVRELLKRDKVDAAEISARLGDLQEALFQAREALGAAQEENRNLMRQIEENRKLADISADMEYVEDGGFYIRKSERDAGKNIPYCPLCWTAAKGAVVPLNPLSGNGLYQCDIHQSRHETAAHREKQASLRSIKTGRHPRTTPRS